MTIIDWLNDQGYDINTSIYSYIDLWQSWYNGNVANFHNYRVFNGKTHTSCRRKSANMAKQACEDWADLLLNEKVHINHPDQTAQDYIVSVLDKNKFWETGNKLIEHAFETGLAAIIPYPKSAVINKDTGNIVEANQTAFAYCYGNQIIPLTVNSGECIECAFASTFNRAKKKYIYLQMFVLVNGLYECKNVLFDTTNDAIKEVDLQTVKGFEGIVPLWKMGSQFVPWVFIKPNAVNQIDPASPFGVAVFAGAIDILQGIDIVYDAYINEFVLGKTRVMVKAEAVRKNIRNENGAMTTIEEDAFDANDLVFYVLPEDAKNEAYVNAIQPLIRAQEMQTGLNDNLNMFSMRCGFGEKHYKFEQGAAATATQVISENSQLFRRLKKHEIVLDSSIKHLCKLILFYGKMYERLPLDYTTSVTIDFDDSIIESKEQNVNTWFRLASSGGMPEYELRARVLNESLEQAKKMVPEPRGEPGEYME